MGRIRIEIPDLHFADARWLGGRLRCFGMRRERRRQCDDACLDAH